jgi:hypothetical protein
MNRAAMHRAVKSSTTCAHHENAREASLFANNEASWKDRESNLLMNHQAKNTHHCCAALIELNGTLLELLLR